MKHDQKLPPRLNLANTVRRLMAEAVVCLTGGFTGPVKRWQRRASRELDRLNVEEDRAQGVE